MKKYFLITAILILIGSGTAFEADFNQLKKDASLESPAVFQIEVQNNNSQPQKYRVNHEFSKTGWLYYNSYKTIPEGETDIFNVTITPGEEALQNSYTLKLFLTEESTGKTKSFSSIIDVERENVLNVKDIQYGKDEVRPGESVSVSVTVQNLDSKIVDGYKVSSRFGNSSKQIQGDPMAPRALKTYDFEYSIPKESRPGEKTLETWINYDQNFQNFSKTFAVKEIRNVTRTSSRVDRGLYVSGSTRISNYGNSKANVSETESFASYAEPLISVSHEPVSTTSNESMTTYTWETVLGPGESIEYSYSIQYWIPLVLSSALILGFLGLRKVTGNVKIKKELDRDGEEIKVSIEIINNSTNSKEVIKVEDFVPNVVELDKDFDMTKPKMKEKSDGTMLYWSLEDFNAGEKRVITYKVSEKYEVENGVDLPPAKIVQDDKIVSKSD